MRESATAVLPAPSTPAPGRVAAERIARFGALEYRYHGQRLQWRVPGKAWRDDPHTPAEFAAVAALARPAALPARPAPCCAVDERD